MEYLHFLLLMVFLHIVDDYYLQGWLASAKQKGWWEINAPNPLYRHDYLMALLMHSISWSSMIMFPSLVFLGFSVTRMFLLLYFLNIMVHFITDNEKANNKTINLIQDQTIHLVQICVTYYIMFC